MSAGGILAPVTRILKWPASRFADVRRSYDLTLPAPDVCALIRGGVGVDRLFRPVGEVFRESASPKIVGRVIGQRFEIYIDRRYASGIGLVGTVEEKSTGSRVITKVDWAGPTKWGMPALMVLLLSAGVANSHDALAAISEGGSDAWVTVAFWTMLGGGYVMGLISTARRARNDDLPMLFERLEAVLARHVQ